MYADNYAGSQAATKLLIDKGCKHIAHIRGPRDVSTANERFEGFVTLLRKIIFLILQRVHLIQLIVSV